MLIIFSLLGIHIGLCLGRLYLPGYAGELCGVIQGFSFTPFFMEFFLVAFGFIVIFLVNHYRTKWEGEELVYIEVEDDSANDLPSTSQTALLKERAESAPVEHTLASLKEAIEREDHDEARRVLNTFSQEEQELPAVKSIIKRLS